MKKTKYRINEVNSNYGLSQLSPNFQLIPKRKFIIEEYKGWLFGWEGLKDEKFISLYKLYNNKPAAQKALDELEKPQNDKEFGW